MGNDRKTILRLYAKQNNAKLGYRKVWSKKRLANINLALDYALYKLSVCGSENETEIEIAGLTEPNHIEIENLLETFERKESIEKLKEKWLYLCLYWIFDHRNDFNDPLNEVELMLEQQIFFAL